MTQITQIGNEMAQIKSSKQFSRIKDRDPLTEKIIACCYRVHSELGPGFAERIYHAALRASLRETGLEFELEKEYRVSYQGKKVGSLRVDLVVDGRVIVELKALASQLPDLFKY